MTRSIFAIVFSLVAICILVPAAAHATDIQTLTQKAQQVAESGRNSDALALYELAMTQSVNQPESVFGPVQGQYWRLIGQSGDFSRAYDFFTALTAEQKNPGATLLASQGSATGAYIGWLYRNKLTADVPAATLQQMDASARRNYARALSLDSDNFTALYGYAIYESYRPNGKAHMKALLVKLNSLRGSHPHYPWALVDYLEQHGHPQM